MSRRLRRATAALILLSSFAAASCGTTLMKLPAGPGAPAADAGEALAEAAKACSGIKAITAEASVSGSAGGQRLRARLNLGLQAPASARIEAIGPFARPFFILAARDGSATLLLNDDNRILRDGRPADVLEALTGVPLDAADLLTALTGCPPASSADGETRQLGADWRLLQDGSRSVYLRRERSTAPWRLVAVVHRPGGGPEWQAEYRDFDGGLPQTVRLASRGSDRFNLRLGLSGIELNPTLPAEAFEIRIPAAAEPITLDELRRAGPLRDETP
jgi:hypothetical protein